ncbi:MAG: hypothetical protein LN415_08125 [Candidatus Thermoplasmatota archaeon]|nr:hypothetical protein [Candidatus Thermoplasmatota archaeon]
MKKGLTKNERRVLHGLVVHPTLNDRKLAEKTKVKHSTITAIRRRLREEGYFKTVRIPSMNKLGCELSVVGYGRFNPSSSQSLRMRFVDTMRRENKGLYHFLMSPDFYFTLSATRDYTSLRRWTEAVEQEFADTRLFNGTSRTSVIFPFELTRQIRFFHFSRPLSLLFGLDEKVTVESPDQKVGSRRLTRKERTVLRGLVEHPEFTDVALSEEINASRQVISSMKRRFERSGLIRTARTVDLAMLGYEILAFVHVRLSPRFPLKSRTDGLQKTVQDLPNYLMFSGNSETMMSGPFVNYNEYFKTRKDTLSFYTHREYILGEPTVELIALSEAEIPVNCDFSSTVGEAIDRLPK